MEARISLEKKQNESIASFPPSSSSEVPSNNANAATPKLISMSIYNKRTGVSSTTKIDRSALMLSDFFKTLVENLDEGESEIALEEDEVYDAVEMLIDLVKIYRKKGDESKKGSPVQVLWNRSKAIMSTKWLLQDYVDAYGALIKKHITDMMSKKPDPAAAVVKVSGITSWSSDDPATATRVPHPANGTYDTTNEQVRAEGGIAVLHSGGVINASRPVLPIYSRRCLSPFICYGSLYEENQWIMEYHLLNRNWLIKRMEDKGTNRCLAQVVCDPPVLPHLIKEVWKVGDRDSPGTGFKPIAQPTVKVSLVPAPPSTDVLLFWEMVGTIFQYVGLLRGPIHTMEDLVEVLSTRRDLCVEEEMEKVMSKKDLLLLQRKIFDRIP